MVKVSNVEVTVDKVDIKVMFSWIKFRQRYGFSAVGGGTGGGISAPRYYKNVYM